MNNEERSKLNKISAIVKVLMNDNICDYAKEYMDLIQKNTIDRIKDEFVNQLKSLRKGEFIIFNENGVSTEKEENTEIKVMDTLAGDDISEVTLKMYHKVFDRREDKLRCDFNGVRIIMFNKK